MKVKALSTINHDGETFQAGQTFECSGTQAQALVESGAAEEAKAASPAPKQEKSVQQPSTPVTPPKNLDKMNRTELEEHATELGMENLDQYDTKVKLVEAVKHYQG